MLVGLLSDNKGNWTSGSLPFLAFFGLGLENTQDELMDPLEEDLIDRLFVSVIGNQPVFTLEVPLLDPQVGDLVGQIIPSFVGSRCHALLDVHLVLMAFAPRELNSMPSLG